MGHVDSSPMVGRWDRAVDNVTVPATGDGQDSRPAGSRSRLRIPAICPESVKRSSASDKYRARPRRTMILGGRRRAVAFVPLQRPIRREEEGMPRPRHPAVAGLAVTALL